MIGIIHYGLGNVRAFENIYRRLDIPAIRVSDATSLSGCDRLILPGVGAFDWAMIRLRQSGMLDALNRRVLDDKVPVLGVCVGMQIMADQSEEGVEPGLGWIPGIVQRFEEGSFTQCTHLPHMGWDDVIPLSGSALFHAIDAPQYYFLHSYYFNPADKDCVIGSTHYGTTFASAVRNGNIWATQFHPEKSHDSGVALLRNFSTIC